MTKVRAAALGVAMTVLGGAVAVVAGRLGGESRATIDIWLVLGGLGAFFSAACVATILMPAERQAVWALALWAVAISGALGYVMAREVFDRNVVSFLDSVLRGAGMTRVDVPAGENPLAFLERPSKDQPFDDRSFFEVRDALGAAGIEGNRFVSVHFILDAVDDGRLKLLPVGGISNEVTIHCSEGDQREQPVNRMDRYGFNNTDWTYAWNRPRIVVLGDSNVFGHCVHQEQTIAGWLRRQGWAAISLGTSGNGPLINLAALREYGPVLKPAYVFFTLFERNDFSDFRDRELRSRSMIRYLKPGYRQNLAVRQAEVDRFWKEALKSDAAWGQTVQAYDKRKEAWIQEGRPVDPALLASVREATGLASLKSLTADDDIVELLLYVIEAAKRETESWGGQFFYVEMRSVLYYRGTWSDPMIDKVTARVRKEGIPVVDIKPLVQKAGQELFFPARHGEPHYNANGYATYGWAMLKAIAEGN